MKTTTIRGGVWRLATVTAAGLLTASTLTACGGGSSESGRSSKEILIGVPAPLTGPSAAWGKQQADAAKAVADAVNAAGGIKELDGAKLKLEVRDTKSDPVECTKIIREFANEHVSAIVGPSGSPEVIASKPLLASLKIPAFTGATDL